MEGVWTYTWQHLWAVSIMCEQGAVGLPLLCRLCLLGSCACCAGCRAALAESSMGLKRSQFFLLHSRCLPLGRSPHDLPMAIDGWDAYSAQHQWISPLKPAQATGASAADDTAAPVVTAMSENMASAHIGTPLEFFGAQQGCSCGGGFQTRTRRKRSRGKARPCFFPVVSKRSRFETMVPRFKPRDTRERERAHWFAPPSTRRRRNGDNRCRKRLALQPARRLS